MSLSIADIERAKRIMTLNDSSPDEPVAVVSDWQMMSYRMTADVYGIYAQRRALARAMPSVQIWRGREWWH